MGCPVHVLQNWFTSHHASIALVYARMGLERLSKYCLQFPCLRGSNHHHCHWRLGPQWWRRSRDRQ